MGFCFRTSTQFAGNIEKTVMAHGSPILPPHRWYILSDFDFPETWEYEARM